MVAKVNDLVGLSCGSFWNFYLCEQEDGKGGEDRGRERKILFEALCVNFCRDLFDGFV